MKIRTPGWLVFLLVGVLGFLAACQQERVETREEAEQAVRAASEAWMEAVAEKNLDKSLSFYADDAFVLPYEAPLARQASEIRRYWRKSYDTPGFDLQWTPIVIEVSQSRDLAYEVGTFELVVHDDAGEPVLTRGKYLAVWAKQADGQWKVAAEAFNKNE